MGGGQCVYGREVMCVGVCEQRAVCVCVYSRGLRGEAGRRMQRRGRPGGEREQSAVACGERTPGARVEAGAPRVQLHQLLERTVLVCVSEMLCTLYILHIFQSIIVRTPLVYYMHIKYNIYVNSEHNRKSFL